MRYSTKRLGLVALMTLMVPLSQKPGFSEENRFLHHPEHRLQDERTLAITDKPEKRLQSKAIPVGSTAKGVVGQTNQVNDDVEPLLQVNGVLEASDATLIDGSPYDAYTFEGRAGQTVGITLESIDFDTFLLLLDSNDKEVARNDDIDTEAGNFHSFVTLTLPADGTYTIWANGYDEYSQGRYRLTVVETSSEFAAPVLSSAELADAEANRLVRRGIQQYEASKFQEALQSLEQALTIYRELGDRKGEADALGELGNIYYFLDQYEQSTDFLQQQLVLAREIGDRWGEANALSNL